ncbi:MAG: hypothetical protein IRZ16_14945 [Myxococcaceae bacterium]|nr:hypothetical protein [Myxococcaceae bacterium]
MIVYGDHARVLLPREELQALRERLRRLGRWRGAPPIERHGALVAAFLRAAQLAQGLIDQRFEEHGRQDAADPLVDACHGALLILARAVVHSFEAGLRWPGGADPSALDALLRCALPERITCRQPEGFAFYAAYPEAWAAAAKRIGAREVRCVGIRTIGTALAPMVQASVRGMRPIVTVRPVGHPYARTICVEESLADAFTRGGPGVVWAIADEGPGRSGSSFAAVCRWLGAHGVPCERIHLLPSHDHGPGPEATDEVRAIWSGTRRHVVTFDELFLAGDSPLPLTRWFEDLIGLVERFDDLSAGAWRAVLCGDAASWPPAHPFQERRKFLLQSERGTWLARFCGLGDAGAEAFARARAVADAGFAPPVIAERHGFSLERWETDARPLADAPPSRRALIHRVGAYLGFRARRFPAETTRGAPLTALFQMARFNAQTALGDDAARAIASFEPALGELASDLRRVNTDNRLHAWEWLVTKDGRILKTDGADHCRGHDLIGSQDIAWDLAGAEVELALTGEEMRRLIATAVDHGARRPSQRLLDFYRLAYPAFWLGHFQLALEATADERERRRLCAQVDRYARVLRRYVP